MKAYVLVGLPGSGKSTFIKNHIDDFGGYIPKIVSRDIIRADLGYAKNSDDKKLLSKEDEMKVSAEHDNRINQLAQNNEDVIIDNTNTNSKFRKILDDQLHDLGYDIIFVEFNTPLEDCIKRRDGQIPADVMQKLFDSYNSEKYDNHISVTEMNDNDMEWILDGNCEIKEKLYRYQVLNFEKKLIIRRIQETLKGYKQMQFLNMPELCDIYKERLDRLSKKLKILEKL